MKRAKLVCDSRAEFTKRDNEPLKDFRIFVHTRVDPFVDMCVDPFVDRFLDTFVDAFVDTLVGTCSCTYIKNSSY